ncbi:MAG TPA: TonB-dependent receptor [Gemmatimonadaceae bacterium]|nr:TonB-dependent receptor [Gemmatimonadaceae bacterium]
MPLAALPWDPSAIGARAVASSRTLRLARVAAVAILAIASTASGGEAQRTSHALHGRVIDTAGAPLAGVRVVVTELSRAQTTSDDGRFRFGAVTGGRYTLSFSRVGLAPESRRVVVEGSDRAVDVAMRPSKIQLAAVQVTATPAATRAQESPQPIAVLEGPELRASQGAALGETLELVPGVRSLSMTTGIGKPVIRGMTHYRVVTLDNGQRTETQAWGHDHSPNVETATADRVEVIKGPASVLYGSDALGGVINVVAPAVPDALDVPSFVRGRLATMYNSNVRGADGTMSLEGATGGLGARAAVTVRGSGDMRTPGGALSNTNNRAVASEGAVGFRAPWGSLAARYAGRGERIEIYDNPVSAPGYTGFQLIDTHRATLELNAPIGGARLQVNGGYEQNYRREFADVAATRADLGLFVRNWTGLAHLHHAPIGPLSGTVGVSGMTSAFENLGTKTLIPSSDTRNAAVYAFEQAELGRWKATVGGRYDWRSLDTDGNASIGVLAQARTFSAVTGSAGLLYKLSDPVNLVFNVARGFRAPAAPDLFANGFHEGTRAFERGNPDVGVETSLNTELGVRVATSNLTAEASGFVNRVHDYVYLRPFGTSGGAFDSLQVVQGDARLAGVEARVAYRPIDFLTLQASGDYVRGQNLTSAVPLTFIPPLRLVYGVRLEGGDGGTLRNRYLSVTGESNARQTRIDPRDVAPPGYTVTSLAAGFTRLVPRGPVTVDLSVRNVFNTRYRSFMSRYKEFADGPGRAVVLRVATPL